MSRSLWLALWSEMIRFTRRFWTLQARKSLTQPLPHPYRESKSEPTQENFQMSKVHRTLWDRSRESSTNARLVAPLVCGVPTNYHCSANTRVKETTSSPFPSTSSHDTDCRWKKSDKYLASPTTTQVPPIALCTSRTWRTLWRREIWSDFLSDLTRLNTHFWKGACGDKHSSPFQVIFRDGWRHYKFFKLQETGGLLFQIFIWLRTLCILPTDLT